MSNQFYNYGSSSYDGSAASSLYSIRSAANPYLPDAVSSRLASADPFSAAAAAAAAAAADTAMYSSYDLGADQLYARYSKPTDAYRYSAAAKTPAGSADAAVSGARRSVEALYHQSILGSHSTIGQSQALYSTNLVKRPRFESNLPIYPQRPGEKDCAHYMLTRTCKCHLSQMSKLFQKDLYYMKTQKCKFGSRCKFNHPKEMNGEGNEISDVSVLPERPSEPLCTFYAKTGKCKFGANCKFHHPKDIQIPLSGEDAGATVKAEAAEIDGLAGGDSMLTMTHVTITPALFHNSKGLPIRPGETDCPFYMKTGSCKYGATCRYNHPDRYAITPPLAAAVGQTVLHPTATNLPFGVLNPTANLFQSFNLQPTHASLALAPTVYPQRPGEVECDYYMKTGQCKFADRCRFHHPIDRAAPVSDAKQTLNVKLTLAGLPRREGATACSFYMKTGMCKFGSNCRFDHPPPREAVAMAAMQGSGDGEEGEN
ncbi:Zinc finger CCCH domain-containing protein 8 [Ananas comosus]|uniref:Zinc finger CCCH domain-containing protein 8 n=1 Tax=Ananas comosus TaxID=4615 RepID=A0A199W1I7_ANACO|nr:Zinc finger CCCH domain-containing protein 8 [Ananas comosus]